MSSIPTVPPASQQENTEGEIDILSILVTLLENKFFIILFTLLFMCLGVLYALQSTPIYRANAIIQVEKKSSGLPGFSSEMGDLFGGESEAVTEIELIKSRRVIGEAVDAMKLDIISTPVYFPVIGESFTRLFPQPAVETVSIFGRAYATGDENINITRFDIPDNKYGKPHLVVTHPNRTYELYDEEDTLILSCMVGESCYAGDYLIYVSELAAHEGQHFQIKRARRLNTILKYQGLLSAAEKGRDSGIINLTIDNPSADDAKRILEEISKSYVRQNVERQSAEAAKSVAFLREQLPQVKKDLEKSETQLNEYQVKAGSVDISAEAEVLLEQVVDIESRIATLKLEKAELDRKYTSDHPAYKSWQEQLLELNQRKSELSGRVKGLPATQQELLALKRDLEVGTEIYTQMLNNIQELDIVRAGTVGNVRIIDEAAVNLEAPVKPKKSLIVAVTTLLGLLVSVAYILVREALNKGIENPEEIEAIGLPVYASVPLSETQRELDKNNRHRPQLKRALKSNTHPTHLLAQENPTDISIESLRSLRTSLHFALLEAKNNVIMISGPSPTVGKSFISGNLAAVVAQTGQRVLLIDADMRKGYIHKMFGLSNQLGLSDVLVKNASIEEAIADTNVGELLVLPRGNIPPNPSELLMTQGLTEIIDYASANFDLVIVDTPPVLAVTDAAIVGQQCGVTLLVTRFGFNPIKELAFTKKRFEQNGIAVKGVIFNAVQRKSAGYGYGYGYYNYHYEYKSDTTS